MKKLTRAVLYVFGALLGLFAVVLLGVNLYVQSRGTHARIEEELSRRLGTTLRIERISVTPWWGLKLRGITIPQSDATMDREFLRADTFRLRIRFASLFARELVIKEIALVHPTIVWAQNKEGKWRIPGSPPNEPLAAGGEEPHVEATNTPAVEPAANQTPASEPTTTAFTPEVRRVLLTNGNFHFLDAKQRPVAAFEGIRFRSGFRSTTELSGNASIARISLRNRFFLQDLNSPLKYDPASLEFSAIRANAGGGEISGQFLMQPSQPGSPFSATVNFHDVQADRLITDAGGPKGMLQGRLEGTLDASGKTSDSNALTGAGEIYLRDGQLRQYALLVALGQLLEMDELAQLQFEEAHVKYHITPGLVSVDELLLRSANIRLAAHGTIDFDGHLRLDSQLAINERIKSQLFHAMQANFHSTDEPNFAAVDFNISGTVDKPKTNLMNKLVGPDLKDIGGLIGGFLGRGRSKRERRATNPEAAVSPAPENGTDAQPAGTP